VGGLSVILTLAFLCLQAGAQEAVILAPDQLAKVVPPSFYYEGQLAPTQMRNAAAVQFQGKRHFMAALVDTSGYSSDIRAKYEGFFILDAPVTIGGAALKPGAYGFGFAQDGKLNLYDLGGNALQSVATQKDEKAKSPRPLTIAKSGNELRLYRGRTFATIALK
jgi:hypothetical protein